MAPQAGGQSSLASGPRTLTRLSFTLQEYFRQHAVFESELDIPGRVVLRDAAFRPPEEHSSLHSPHHFPGPFSWRAQYSAEATQNLGPRSPQGQPQELERSPAQRDHRSVRWHRGLNPRYAERVEHPMAGVVVVEAVGVDLAVRGPPAGPTPSDLCLETGRNNRRSILRLTSS